jgi:hypothetical protein
MKRPLPVTICTLCASAGYNLSLTDLRCAKNMSGERCNGTNSSARNAADWLECSSCEGIGAKRNKPCARCGGVGWLLARKASCAVDYCFFLLVGLFRPHETHWMGRQIIFLVFQLKGDHGYLTKRVLSRLHGLVLNIADFDWTV